MQVRGGFGRPMDPEVGRSLSPTSRHRATPTRMSDGDSRPGSGPSSGPKARSQPYSRLNSSLQNVAVVAPASAWVSSQLK